MKTWYIKIKDNTSLTWFKDRLFRAGEWLNLNTFVEEVIEESPTIESIVSSIEAISASPINYTEFTYSGDNISQKKVYTDSTLSELLFTFNYTYTGDNLTQVEVIRESDGYTYYKDLSYDLNNNLINIEIHV